MLLVYVFALGAALLFGIGSVVQQHAAAQAPPEHNMSVKLLLWLVRQPLWLAGVGTALFGNLLSASALGRGSVALVEPLLVVRLLFALPLAAAWMRVRVPRRDWAGAIATAIGLAIFVVVGQPRQGTAEEAPLHAWIIGGGSIIVLSLVMATVGKRLHPARGAALLAGAAGLLFGLQAALTHAAVGMLGAGGLVGMLASWYPYAVLATALLGTLFIQSAYELAPLPASFPALVTAEPLVGIAVGVGVLGGTIRLAPAYFAIEILGLLVMLGGVYLLATSPIVTGQFDRLVRRQEEGLAFRTEAELDRDEARLRRDVERLQADLAEPGAMRRRDRRALERDLARVDREITRLCDLQEDIERHRQAEQAHRTGQPEEAQARAIEHDRDLDHRQDELNERAEELQRTASELKERVSALLQEEAVD